MCDFKQSTESVGLKIHPDKTKILRNQSSNKRKEVEINNIKVAILLACESAKYLGQTTTFQQQETANIKNRIRAARASLQIQPRADIKIVLPTTQTPLIQHGDHADAEVRLWHLDVIKRIRKNDTINSTQNASPHRANKEKIQKKTQPSRNEEDEEDEKAQAQMKKLQRVAVQTQITTKTAPFSS